MSEIQFKVDKKGNVSLEVKGVTDMSCEELTREFEEALGVKTKIDYKEGDFVVLDGIANYVSEGE